MLHRDDCGGCPECHPYYDEALKLEREESAFTENARQSLVAAAHDLVKYSNVTDRELAALEALLAVFDPQEDPQEEEQRQEEGRF